MIMHVILAILTIATSGSICYFTGTYTLWYLDILYAIILPFFYVIWFGIYVGCLWIASLFMSRTKKIEHPGKISYFFVRQTCILVLFLFRARIKRSGPELPEGRYVFIQNHTSNFDPMPAIYFSKNQPLLCITKEENEFIPIAGKFIHNAGFIPIDRENDFNAVKSIVKGANYIKKNEASIFVCPEGTRNKHPENGLLEFKGGTFKLAYKSQAPIAVIALSNAHKIVKNFPFKHTNVYMDVCEIIPYEKYKDMNSIELAEYCKMLIANKLAERG